MVDEYVEFVCPSCSKAKIVRCADCRKEMVEYTCLECGFVGP